MPKFLLNLLVQIFKAFVYSKIQILFGNNSPQLPAQPARVLVVPYPVATFLSSRSADGWTPPVIPHLRSARARSRHHHLPSLPAPPSSTSDAARAFTTPPSLPPSLTPLLTSPLPSMALMPLTPPLLPPATPLWRSPGPYKRAMRPPALTAPHPLPPELFHALLRPRDELKPPPLVASGAPPLRHPSVAGDHLPSTASTGSSFPSIVGENRRASSPVHRTPARRRRALCLWLKFWTRQSE
jgi:hypothetical protein